MAVTAAPRTVKAARSGRSPAGVTTELDLVEDVGPEVGDHARASLAQPPRMVGAGGSQLSPDRGRRPAKVSGDPPVTAPGCAGVQCAPTTSLASARRGRQLAGKIT
jgi:hypothetical protein